MGKQGGALNLDFSNLTGASWPLIAKTYSDGEYKLRYDQYLSEVIAGPFETGGIQALYDTYSALVAPYATSEVAPYTFLESPTTSTVR